MPLELEIDVPESRQVTLPDSVPVGKVKLTVQAPVEIPPPPKGISEKAQRERAAFYRLLPELLKTHHGKVVAIHNEQVIAVGDETLPVAHEAYREIGGRVDLYVAPVLEQQPVERLGGPREVRGDRS